MSMRWCALVLAGMVVLQATSSKATPMEWSDILALPQTPADAKIAYGKGPSQFGELRLPMSPGPFRVVVLIHGGCWESAYGLDHVRSLAGAITALGFATWSLEYRRLGEIGGGWPGTLLDVGSGVDALRGLAKTYPLDLKRVTAVGHSAGGQLALWAAGRSGLAATSDVAQKDPLAIQSVVALAAISNLEVYSAAKGSCNESALRLLGGAASKVPQRYRDALPTLPASTTVHLVHGSDDAVVPIEMSRAYAHMRAQSHAPGSLLEVAGAGHFDVIGPGSRAWPQVLKALNAGR